MQTIENPLPPVQKIKNLPSKRKQTAPQESIKARRTGQKEFIIRTGNFSERLSQSQIDGNSQKILQEFYLQTDPFYMGATRHDKNKYQGSVDNKANEKLYKYYTIARANRVVKQQELDQSFTVKGNHQGVHNSFKNNRIVQDILRESDIIGKNKDLMQTIYKLKQMQVLNDEYQIKTQQQSRLTKINYVYNDYHTRTTNNGYARNALGTFYTK